MKEELNSHLPHVVFADKAATLGTAVVLPAIR
jgi:hypothetical protein